MKLTGELCAPDDLVGLHHFVRAKCVQISRGERKNASFCTACVQFAYMSRQSQWQQEGELFTFSNIYFCIRYQVRKCKYSESITKSIRNYRECNTNCNKFNMLELSSYHTCKSACQSLTTKVLGFVFIFLSYTKPITISTDYCLFVLENTKTSVYNSI